MSTGEIPPNFRPLMSSHNKSFIYRSSNPDVANSVTISRWCDDLKIRTIIDLRNFSELDECIRNGSALSQGYRLETLPNILSGQNSKSTSFCRRVNLTFTNWRYKMKVFFSFPVITKSVVAYLYVKSLFTQNASEVENYGGRHFFNRKSQWEMYATFLDWGSDCIRNVFKVLLHEDLYSVLICCHAGKDRTGVICALIMNLLGCSREEIVAEYEKSEKLLAGMQDEVDQSFMDRELDPIIFGKSPAITMESFLEYFYKKYGDTSNYLRQLGFSSHDIDQIKQNLTHQR